MQVNQEVHRVAEGFKFQPGAGAVLRRVGEPLDRTSGVTREPAEGFEADDGKVLQAVDGLIDRAGPAAGHQLVQTLQEGMAVPGVGVLGFDQAHHQVRHASQDLRVALVQVLVGRGRVGAQGPVQGAGAIVQRDAEIGPDVQPLGHR